MDIFGNKLLTYLLTHLSVVEKCKSIPVNHKCTSNLDLDRFINKKGIGSLDTQTKNPYLPVWLSPITP